MSPWISTYRYTLTMDTPLFHVYPISLHFCRITWLHERDARCLFLKTKQALNSLLLLIIYSSFTYLGRIYNFSLKNKEAKEKSILKLQSLLKIISNLEIRPQLKLKNFNQYSHSWIKNVWFQNYLDRTKIRLGMYKSYSALARFSSNCIIC